MVEVLEERAIGAGTVTRQGLEGMLSGILDKAGITSAVEQLTAMYQSGGQQPARQGEPEAAVPGGDPPRTQYTRFHWQGRENRVPEDFSFPAGGLLMAWQHFLCGDPVKGYPPFRYLQASDMSNRNLGRRLSDYLFIMNLLRSYLPERLPMGDVSIATAQRLFADASAHLPGGVGQTTAKGRKRRAGQIGWRTVCNIVRKIQKRGHE